MKGGARWRRYRQVRMAETFDACGLEQQGKDGSHEAWTLPQGGNGWRRGRRDQGYLHRGSQRNHSHDS